MLTNVVESGAVVRRRVAAVVGVVVCALGLGLGGCNSSNNALMEANRALTDRVTALTQENESLKNLVGQLQGAVSARDKAISELQMSLNDARSGNTDLQSQLAAFEGKFGSMKFGSVLDPATDTALQDLAREHADMLEYDSSRGVLRFKADVTFDSGSDAVKPTAKSTLTQLAQILNSSASQYDCRVVGHTDSQHLSPTTRQKHTTNLRLSADRAISVRNELVNGGVMAARFEIAGRGEFDPMVPNSSNGNTQQNRHVEVYLYKSTPKIGVMNLPEAPMTPVKTGAKKDMDIIK